MADTDIQTWRLAMSLLWGRIKLCPLSVFLPKALFALFSWDFSWGEMSSQIIPSFRDPEDI